jgi:IPT/TIG domain-containing protein
MPPDHPEAIASAGLPPPPPAPPAAPAPPPPAAACTTADPFVGIPGLYGVCVGTEWYPVGHPLAPAGVAITGVQPSAGTIARWVRIFGVGFTSDTKVTFGGVPATDILLQSGGSMFALAPPHSAGPVDIAVQNSGGLAALAGAYTYQPITVSVTPSIVSPGGDLIVTWTVPGQYWYDWIGLYKVGDPNGSYISYEYTNGTSSGSVRFRAPLEPGWYEFRYLTNDDYYDAARTLPITVIGGLLQ